MAAAFYLARMGADVAIYEKRQKLGGIVSAVIPDFRIDDSVIEKDAALLEKLGVDVYKRQLQRRSGWERCRRSGKP